MFIFCRKSFKFSLIVCMGMFINIGWATPPKDFIMFVGHDIEVANIGEDLLVPVMIKQAKAWESASISFTVEKLTSGNTDPNVVHIKTLKLPAKINTPYTVYVPLTVTGEGHFKVIGKVHMNLAGNRPVYADLPEWTYPLDFEIFALNGKYAVASVAGDTELAKFLVEQEHPQLRPSCSSGDCTCATKIRIYRITKKSLFGL